MKNLLLLLMIAFTLVSCESKKSITDDISKLKIDRISLRNSVDSLNNSKDEKTAQISVLNEKIKELGIYASGKTPKYILTLHLKQTHFSLSITKHIKDAANAIDFELPVDKDFYNSVEIGTNIVDEFRTGSLILSGSFGDWEMTVKGKNIK